MPFIPSLERVFTGLAECPQRAPSSFTKETAGHGARTLSEVTAALLTSQRSWKDIKHDDETGARGPTIDFSYNMTLHVQYSFSAI